MYDLIVIGGGPGGSAAAIMAARQGARVLLLERGKYPRHKVCGEFVSAESLEILRSLLADTGFFQSQSRREVMIGHGRIFVDGCVLKAPIDSPGASLSRFELDAALWAAALSAGVDARQQQAVQSVIGRGVFVVSTTAAQFEGRSVIDASGRWSNLSAPRSQDSNGRQRWIGIKAHFLEPEVPSSIDLCFFEGGYCGVQPLPGENSQSRTRINACAMVRSDVATSLSKVFLRHPALQERSQSWQQLTETVTTSPLTFRRPNPERNGVLLVGDAAGFVDPFVGDGISLALRSGVMAAESLRQFFAGDQTLQQTCQAYRRDYARRLIPIFRTSSQIRRLFHLPAMIRVPLAHLFQHTPALTRYLVQKTR
jgi:flavin-dependent dehydrogenase